jgi:hypothetical protein
VLCISGRSDLGPAGSPTRKTLAKFLTDNGKPASENINPTSWNDLQDLRFAGKKACSQ